MTRTELTDHVLPDVSHGVELLLTDLAGEFLLGVTMHNLVVLVQRPELLEGFSASHTLERKTQLSLVRWLQNACGNRKGSH